jgi:hypothetical protein
MITRPTEAEIVESVRADLVGIVMEELSTERARGVVRLAEQLLARNGRGSVEFDESTGGPGLGGGLAHLHAVVAHPQTGREFEDHSPR